MSVLQIIAKAIKKEDSSYFFENYNSQARAVLRELYEHDLIIVPAQPTKDMIQSGVYAIKLGDVDAQKLAKDIYNKMVGAYK